MRKYKIGDECIIYTPGQLEYHLKKCKVTGYSGTMYVIMIHGQGRFGSDKVLVRLGTLKAMIFKRKRRI